MNTARNRAIKRTFAAMLVGCMAAFSWSGFAHPLGQGNCWPRYHEWRNATFELQQARADLATYVENLNAALAANNATSAALWTLVVALKQMQITAYHEPLVERLRQSYLACDHF